MKQISQFYSIMDEVGNREWIRPILYYIVTAPSQWHSVENTTGLLTEPCSDYASTWNWMLQSLYKTIRTTCTSRYMIYSLNDGVYLLSIELSTLPEDLFCRNIPLNFPTFSRKSCSILRSILDLCRD